MEHLLADIVGRFEVSVDAVEVHESSRIEETLLIKHQPDAPASAFDRLAAMATGGLSSRSPFSAVDPRQAPVREAVARGLVQLLSVGNLRGGLA